MSMTGMHLPSNSIESQQFDESLRPEEHNIAVGKRIVEPDQHATLAIRRERSEVDRGTFAPDQGKEQTRTCLRNKRRKCRYGFPRRSQREKGDRIWKRLFPWNNYRTHL